MNGMQEAERKEQKVKEKSNQSRNLTFSSNRDIDDSNYRINITERQII